MCSGSMFVTTAMVAGKFINVPSDSSASTTIHSPPPNRALVPYALIIPPLTTVGSAFAQSKIAAIKEVVVVLPCVPPTAIDHLSRISSASISARRTIGIWFWRATISSGLFDLIAEDITTTPASPRFSPRWPIDTGMPIFFRRVTLVFWTISLP